jgi:hypothetical protein
MHLDSDFAAPSSAAICFFIRPAVTKPSIPCCFETSTRLQKSYFPGATVTIALESELNRIEKILFAEWFGQEFDRAGLHGSYCHRDIAVSANENDGQMSIGLCKVRLKVEPADTG